MGGVQICLSQQRQRSPLQAPSIHRQEQRGARLPAPARVRPSRRGWARPRSAFHRSIPSLLRWPSLSPCRCGLRGYAERWFFALVLWCPCKLGDLQRNSDNSPKAKIQHLRPQALCTAGSAPRESRPQAPAGKVRVQLKYKLPLTQIFPQ